MGSGNYNSWKTYWANLEVTSSDLQQLTDYLFEKEEPSTVDGLLQVLIDHRLGEREADRKQKLESVGELYVPVTAMRLALNCVSRRRTGNKPLSSQIARARTWA